MKLGLRCLLLLLGFCATSVVGIQSRADTPAFDLAGPKVDVRVARHGKTLPISQVASLAPGDRLWIHPDFPESQSAKYLLIVSFLRGATNPPPDDWFTRVETWKKNVREEGVFVVVPQEAQQALLFLAPETGGDFTTLRTSVRGRPGTFVRATQDLQQASYDRIRLERYLSDVRSISDADAKGLHEKSLLLSRSLGIKVDQQCFDKPTVQQVPCLLQHTDSLVLDDVHSQSMVSQWTTGTPVDLVNQISSSQLGGSGVYSAYVGAVVDLAKLMGSIHNAQYQYIPALAMPYSDTLNLRLNTPPSFRNPKSVLVIPLPSVQKAQSPPLRVVTANQSYCSERPDLVLPVDGAPLVFASDIAHEMVLRIPKKEGKSLDLPVKADALQGGLVVDISSLKPEMVQPEFNGTLVGKWGFDEFTGPSFHMISPRPLSLALAPTDKAALVVDRDDTLHFSAENLSCVDSVDMKESEGRTVKLSWKLTRPDSFEVSVPLKNVKPGKIEVQVKQFGLAAPSTFTLEAYAEAAHLDGLTLNAGEASAVLKGTRLDQVASVEIANIRFSPSGLQRVNEQDELLIKTPQSVEGLKPAQKVMAHISLQDGRVLDQAAVIGSPRPKVSLLSKGPQSDEASTSIPIRMGKPDDLPGNGKLVFFLKSEVPASFPRTEKVEVSAEDDSFRTVLSLADGRLVLQDAQTALGVLDPVRSFGGSAFGPLRLRAVDAKGLTGDWIPLGTLVRLPELKELRCPRSVSKPCVLSGGSLFLVTAVASNAEFTNPVEVPPAFTANTLVVPHPAGGLLYMKLRDDPSAVQTVSMPITFATQPSATATQATSQLPVVATPPPPAADSEKTPPSTSSTPQQ